MLKIKLARFGKKKHPQYRIVVAEEGGKREGKYIEKIGFYNPISNPHQVKIDIEKLEYWLKNGAQFSEGVYKVFKSQKDLRKYLKL